MKHVAAILLLSNRYEYIFIDDTLIERVTSYKFLGILIDDKLTFKLHIELVQNKLSRNLGIMRKLNFLPKKILVKLYYSIIYPFLIYGLLIWGSTFTTSLNSLVIIQKKVVRVITGSVWYHHTNSLFKNVEILKFNDLFDFLLNVFMFKVFFFEK